MPVKPTRRDTPDIPARFSFKGTNSRTQTRGTFALTHGTVVQITNARDLARAVITVKGKNHTASCYVQPISLLRQSSCL